MFGPREAFGEGGSRWRRTSSENVRNLRSPRNVFRDGTLRRLSNMATCDRGLRLTWKREQRNFVVGPDVPVAGWAKRKCNRWDKVVRLQFAGPTITGFKHPGDVLWGLKEPA